MCVSGDQLESSMPGLVPTFQGSPATSSYRAGTLFVDHASRYLYFTPHISTGTQEAVAAKHCFELHAMSFNRPIHCYHTDNGIFRSKLFRDSCTIHGQGIRFSGVNAHHQNGLAERYIHTITKRAHTMIIHAMIHWPDIIHENLWPFALRHAVAIHNATPGISNLSLEEIFIGTKHPSRLPDFHTFGCPIFVLDPNLQQGNKIPKWKPQSQQGLYLGPSPDHASTVPLVLNTQTGLVSPQYHVVFVDNFTTVNCLQTDKIPTNWPSLFNESATFYVDEDFSHTNFCVQRTPNLSSSDSSSAQREVSNFSSIQPQREASSVTQTHPQREVNPDTSSSSDPTSSISLPCSNMPHTSPPDATTSNDAANNRVSHGWNSAHPHNTRFKKKFQANLSPVSLHEPPSFDVSDLAAFLAHNDNTPLPNDTNSCILPLLALSTKNNPDTLHFGEMQRDPDRPHFESDMQHEVQDLLDNNCIKVVPRSSMPSGDSSLPAIWSFCCKHAPDWSITKWKSRLCPHGGKQIEGQNFWDTYAPLTSWRTICLTLVLSLLSNLKTRQLDYVAAFPQADADCKLYMNKPLGFIVDSSSLCSTHDSTKNNSKHHVLKLLKNVYGLRQAGKVRFDKLCQGLLDRGFIQSSIDPCLFYQKDVIFIIYVDDCLLFSSSEKVRDDLFNSLTTEFKLTYKGDVSAYLGIDIKRRHDCSLELLQPGLIQKVITPAGLESNSAQHDTPVPTILHDDPTGPEREHTWNYRAVIGMLNYLASSTHPDIAFATHQCACYCTHPKRLHELAVCCIARYLKGTSNKGYILCPTKSSLNLDCYVDADFAGLWTLPTSSDPMSVKSCTGYVLTFASCPLLWSSKLQSEVALSTTEAEYIALSQATQDIIPLRNLLHEFASITKLIVSQTITYSTIFEDNKGCVELVNAPRLHPCTHHIGLKYHHFRHHVAKGDIRVQWIDTKHQLADIFTKPLPSSTFKFFCQLLLGW